MLSFTLVLLLFALPAQADTPGWQTYASKDYNFSIDYPANWQRFENVNTALKAQGMKAVFTLCLTPGPVKTLSCLVSIDVVPVADFAPPKNGKFYGLPAQVEKGEAGAEWQSVSVPQGASKADVLVSDYATRKGFVYLISDRGLPKRHDVMPFRFLDVTPAAEEKTKAAPSKVQ